MAQDQITINALCAKIFATLNAGDTVNSNASPRPDGSFVSFAVPGPALTLEDIRFGFSPVASEIEAASAFADFANNVPNPTGFFRTSQNKVWDEYKHMLQAAVLGNSHLTQEEQQRLDRATNALYSRTQIQDIVTGDLVDTIADTALYERYSKLKADYEDQLLSYNARLINVQTNPNNPQILADFNINGPIYRSRVRQAFDRMVSSGSNTVDTALAVIDQLSGRDPARLFADARDRLNSSRRFDLNGQEYYFTKYFPTTFVNNPAAWTQFSMTSEEVHTTDTSTSTSWGGGAGIGFGLWSFGASAHYGSQQSQSTSDVSDFSLTMELTRLPLRRSWFTPGLLTSRSWKFPETDPDPLSDGAIPPHGRMIGYITDFILARNVKVSMDMTTERNSHAASQFSASASVGWGPFSLRGGYTRNTSSSTHDFTHDNVGFFTPGMMIIGFVCQFLPKAPNPLPGIFD